MSQVNFSLSIIIPSKNDESVFMDSLFMLLEFLKKKTWDWEVILVSNGSHKENINLISTGDEPYFKHITLKESGKGLAIKEGIKESKHDYILFVDADFSVSISEIDKFLQNGKPLGNVVIGTRRTTGSVNMGTPIIRKIGGAVYLFFVNSFFRLNLTDTQCGFKLFKKSEYQEIEDIKFNNFSFDIELLYKLSKKNKIYEIPVEYVHNPDSKVSLIKDSSTMFFDLIKLRLR